MMSVVLVYDLRGMSVSDCPRRRLPVTTLYMLLIRPRTPDIRQRR